MKSSSLLLLVGVAILGGLVLFSQPNDDKTTPSPTIPPKVSSTSSSIAASPAAVASVAAAKVVEITLSKRQLQPNQITVNQGNKVVINVTSDESGEFHLTGYEIEHRIDANAKTEIAFTADKAGRFVIELHPEGKHDDIAIGAFVVSPK
jgi:hypothetical protein